MRSFLFFLAALTFCFSAFADDTVRAAQTRLQSLGFYDFPIDGEWGPRTAGAVERYQLAQDLDVTGNLDRRTLDSLGIRPAARSTATPIPLARAIADLFAGGPYLRAPTEFQLRVIKEAQQNLRTLGYYGGPIDGLPSPTLANALKTYQKSSRFKATGRLDKTTLQALDLLTLPYGY